MKPKYILTKRAEQDLTSIWRYTAETWSQKQANKYIHTGDSNCFFENRKSAYAGRSLV